MVGPRARREAAEAAPCLTVFVPHTAERARIRVQLNFIGGVSDEQCHRRGYATRSRSMP